MRNRTITALTIAALAVVGAFGAALVGGDDRTRQEQVRQRGAAVMPFSLDATTHVFDADARGGIQRVVAKDPSDVREVRLIREHLREEARAFRGGDFGDPASIHGEDMRGLRELRAGYRDISLRYRDLPDGGEISYRTTDPGLVSALRAWFDAQLRDHAGDATSPDHGAHPGHDD